MKPSNPDKIIRGDDSPNTEQLEARRQALKDMLASNEARYQKAAEQRRPRLVPGAQVAIVSGELHGKKGVVLDADFITARVYLDIKNMINPQWISFEDIGSV